MEEVKFHPGKLLQAIVQIYINLMEEEAFVAAIPRDGRSYHSKLFEETAGKLRKLYVPEEIVSDLLKVRFILLIYVSDTCSGSIRRAANQ